MDVNFEEYQRQLRHVEERLNQMREIDESRAELLELRLKLLELLELRQGNSEEEESTDDNAVAAADDEDTHAVAVEALQSLKSSVEELIGHKCMAPHQHAWGAVVHHNALVCGVGDGVHLDSDSLNVDVMVRVLFTNPTHREMVPCLYFLGGHCRFDADSCRYSHGELVSFDELRDYEEPNFELLVKDCIVLAKMMDHIWYRGRVLFVDDSDRTCLVRLESKEHKKREMKFDFKDLLPIYQDDEVQSNDSMDDNDDDVSSSESDIQDDYEAARHALMVEKSLLTCQNTQALGEWEKHTRGIGSKLMSKMGYVIGTGLGSDGRGIVTPVSAQILPQGRSLDHCMELREKANGDKDLFSVERKLKRQQKRQAATNAKAYARNANRDDLFSFLNNSVLPSGSQMPSNSGSPTKKPKKDLSEHTNRALNVESMRIADEIRKKERDIDRVRESLGRNSGDQLMQKRLLADLKSKTEQLHALQEQAYQLSKEQTTRKTKDKLCVF